MQSFPNLPHPPPALTAPTRYHFQQTVPDNSPTPDARRQVAGAQRPGKHRGGLPKPFAFSTFGLSEQAVAPRKEGESRI